MSIISFSKGQTIPGASLSLTVTPAVITVQAFCPYECEPEIEPPVDGGLIHKSLTGKKMYAPPPRQYTLASFIERPDWADYSIWAIPVYPSTKRLKAPVNCWTESYVGKQRSNMVSERIGESKVLYIFVPHKGATFDQMGFHAHIHKDGYFFCNRPAVERDVSETREAVMPKLTMTTPKEIKANGAAGTFNLKLSAPLNLDVYLESDSGYLPKRRVKLDKGVGAFKLLPLGLDAGDEIKVKAGFKFFSGAAEAKVKVA